MQIKVMESFPRSICLVLRLQTEGMAVVGGLKKCSENMVLVMLLQTGAKDLTYLLFITGVHHTFLYHKSQPDM